MSSSPLMKLHWSLGRTWGRWHSRKEAALSFPEHCRFRWLTEPWDSPNLCFCCLQKLSPCWTFNCEWLRHRTRKIHSKWRYLSYYQNLVLGLEGITCPHAVNRSRSQRTGEVTFCDQKPESCFPKRLMSARPQRILFLNCLNLVGKGWFHAPGAFPAYV